MSSTNKQQKRAQRAKAKAKQARVERQSPKATPAIVPDYFMPNFLAPIDEQEKINDDLPLEAYVEPELLATMDDDERAATIALMNDTSVEMPTEDELLLWEVFDAPAPEPDERQRLTHFAELKLAEQDGIEALLLAFANGPVAAHALYNIDIEDYEDVLLNTIGRYFQWAHGLDEQSARKRISSDEFLEALRDAYSEIEEARMVGQYTTGRKKQDESGQD